MKVALLQGPEILEEKILGEEVAEVEKPPADDFERRMIIVTIVQYASILFLPLLLAVILSALMRRHRNSKYLAEHREATHASITRRAIAQLIDVLVLAAPPILGMLYGSTSHWPYGLGQVEGFRGFLLSFTPAFAGLALSAVSFLLFAYAEGSWGITPGKWVARIRVLGTDLRPCGFPRALVRNLLKVIDGFFNFMVGVMLVALTENWQRVGDMVARTIVIDARNRS